MILYSHKAFLTLLLTLPMAFALTSALAAGSAREQDPDSGLAEQMLDRIVKAQIVEGPPQRVEGYAMTLNVRERGETTREYNLDLLYRTDDGGLIRIEVQDQQRGTKVSKGFDGSRYWLLEDDGAFHDLSGREYAKDRDGIDDAIELAQELLLVFDLDRLRREARDLVVGKGATGGPALGGKIDRGREEWSFLLHLAENTEQPVQLELIPPGATAFGLGPNDDELDPEAPVSRRYSLRDQKAYDGRLLPKQILEYYGAAGRPSRIVEIRAMRWRKPPARADLIVRGD